MQPSTATAPPFPYVGTDDHEVSGLAGLTDDEALRLHAHAVLGVNLAVHKFAGPDHPAARFAREVFGELADASEDKAGDASQLDVLASVAYCGAMRAVRAHLAALDAEAASAAAKETA